jgi:hypothetical protein
MALSPSISLIIYLYLTFFYTIRIVNIFNYWRSGMCTADCLPDCDCVVVQHMPEPDYAVDCVTRNSVPTLIGSDATGIASNGRRRDLPVQAQLTAALDNPASGESCTPYEELAAAAEAELSAFYAAVRTCYGPSWANAAADFWLRAFASANIDPCALAGELRKITIAAACSLACAIRFQRS